MICPCKDCEKKGCGNYHSQCEAYLEFVEYRKRFNERERLAKKMYYNTNLEGRKKWNKKN